MRKRKNPCCLCVTAILAIILALHPLVGLAFEDTAATQPVSYSFISIDIPNFSGELGFTSLADINNDGEITGGFTNSSGFGFLLGETFRLTDIQCPESVVLSAQPQSINKHGEIAGFCFTGGRERGFFRDKKGTYTLLDFPGATLTEALGVNDDGQVVGSYRDSDGSFHGFFWDAGLFLTFDIPIPGANPGSPSALNNVGQIVGGYLDTNISAAFPIGHAHGLLIEHGRITVIEVPGASDTFLMDINDRGAIVGLYLDGDMVPRSFVLEDGRFTTINVPFPDAVFTGVSGINNQGQIVGQYAKNNPDDLVNPFSSHGFIATPQDEPKNKSQLLVSKPNDSANFKRWTKKDVEERGHQLGKWRRLFPRE